MRFQQTLMGHFEKEYKIVYITTGMEIVETTVIKHTEERGGFEVYLAEGYEMYIPWEDMGIDYSNTKVWNRELADCSKIKQIALTRKGLAESLDSERIEHQNSVNTCIKYIEKIAGLI